ncbi:MAG: class I SAM-dependent methyltransferase [Rikenellaceae bacterium]
MVNKELTKFIRLHKLDDIQRLLLSSDKYPGIDVKLAAKLISAKKKIDRKVPLWREMNGLVFPDNLSVEQSSSELTAEYKKRFVNGGVVIDLTGGLGVDSFFLSQKAKHLFYFDKNKELCESAKYNFNYLRVNNITVSNCEISKESIKEIKLSHADLIYLDPSRRDNNHNRVYAITDYRPNILDIKEDLLELSNIILVKVSPMVDISATIGQISEITEIHVLSVNNECKELLFLLSRGRENSMYGKEDIRIFTVNFCKEEQVEHFDFNFAQENICMSEFSGDNLSGYLYEPNASILKAGAFKSLGEFFKIRKLHKNTHLYTSFNKIDDFPGRSFMIKNRFDFNKETIKGLRKKFPKANISTRNFPLTPDELKKLLKIKDGGDAYIFGCTTSSGAKKILICSKVS